MSQTRTTAPCAAIDIGSNSTAMAIARCALDRMEILADDSTMLRTGEDTKTSGEISQETQERLISILHQYQERGKKQKAHPFLVVATEAMREARNNQAIVENIERETGLRVNIIPGALEAALTYHGATFDPSVPPDAGVLDVGGSSTELVTARQRHITWLTSLPIGSGWLHDQFLSADPPVQDEIEDAQDFLQNYLSALHTPSLPLTLMVTGSSAKALLKLAQQVLHLDEKSDRFTRKDLSACLSILQTLGAQELAERYHLEAERARVLPGGALLLLEMMAYLRLDEVRVSRAGVREGVLLAYTRYGEHWLDHPEVRVNDPQIGKPPPLPQKVTQKPEAHQPFARSGQEELAERAKKFLNWQDEVLKNEEVEAVHKMRVASRRLRATLDAYQTACRSKAFRRAYKQVKQAADLLGAARDTDVMLQHVNDLLQQAGAEEQAGLHWLANRLSACRKQEQKQLKMFFQKFDAAVFEQEVTTCILTGGEAHG